MPEIKFDGITELQKTFRELGDPKTFEAIAKYSLYDAAGYLADELKKETPVDTGDLRESIITTPMEHENGNVTETITFTGYDRKGVPNLLKARVLESGRRGPRGITGKNPFVRKTVRRCATLATFLIDKAAHEYLAKFSKKRGL